MYNRALALTGNADAAQALADNIAAIPSETDWKVIAQTAAAQAQLETFIDRNSGRTITVNTVLNERVAGFNSAGGITSANGNLVAYANGGFAPGIYAGRPGAIHKFAEPETRWEAYISGKPGQETRNLAIWEAAGERLGAFSAPLYARLAASGTAFADGGMANYEWAKAYQEQQSFDPRALSPMSTHYSTTTVDNSKTVAPTVSLGSGNTFYSYDPEEIARRQSRELRRSMTLAGF
ncbi:MULTISPECIES: hypothetical protein [unclassified Rathayibacter]|uniref:hypothetical protein n=1 Tax=unclassified Rathayibacter TaxID=2609250 RepID=UPI000CE8937B|nr:MULTISPECIES: hypothetical protein [unclassified Rathayibacter]PPI39244.1 hypothetical protein C5D50_08760 [Rathayibacter sp. RFBD1]PPI57278.1 hypothetical protein C5D38_08340 [Rathayibacter sp. TRS19]